jgi:hypothetical protein
MVWLIRGIHYLCDNKLAKSNKLSINDLGGTVKTPRGLLDMLVFKLEVVEAWLNKDADECGLSNADKQRIRTNMLDFVALEAAKESTWQALLNPSGKKFADLVEVPARSCQQSYVSC